MTSRISKPSASSSWTKHNSSISPPPRLGRRFFVSRRVIRRAGGCSERRMKKGCIVSKLRSQNDTRGIACVSCWRNARAAVGADIIRPRRMQLPFASITTHSQSVILRRRAGREAPACGILLSVRGGRRATRPTAKPESMRFRRRMARFRVRPARAVGDASPYEAPIETGCRAGTCAPP